MGCRNKAPLTTQAASNGVGYICDLGNPVIWFASAFALASLAGVCTTVNFQQGFVNSDHNKAFENGLNSLVVHFRLDYSQ
jgi:hypothetical protein